MENIHRLVFYLKRSFLETTFCRRLQMEPTHVGPIEKLVSTGHT
jgi:hypothetical protein